MEIDFQVKNQCYCCCQRPRSRTLSKMDLDIALNELGMLSTTTEGRTQFMREKKAKQRMKGERSRNLSEPGTSSCIPNGSDIGSMEYSSTKVVSGPYLIPDSLSSTPLSPRLSPVNVSVPATPYSTPQGSPAKGNYQILQLNPVYVTSVNGGNPLSKLDLTLNNANCSYDNSQKFSPENLDNSAKTNRLSRVKLSRIRRFRKPYEVPWRRNIEECYGGAMASLSKDLSSYATPDKLHVVRPADTVCANSNPSTPEKLAPLNPIEGFLPVPRSKSLDESDFAKLRTAEVQNCNFIQEKREIEHVSQHLRNLQVHE